VVNSAKDNFTGEKASKLGLSRSDTRAYIDARGNSTWDDAGKVRSELNKLEGTGDLNKVKEVVVMTTEGPVKWSKP
ncbi:hypothetical protein, partial [Zooshikella harenae]